jgi:GNAT superfamily N-acetyltransferase
MNRVRRADEADADAVVALLRELGYSSSPDDVRARLGETDAVLLAEEGAGLIALHRIPRLAEGGSFARITALVVAPERRGEGVGRTLIAAAEEVAREWGCALLEVSSGRRPELRRHGERSVRYRKRL